MQVEQDVALNVAVFERLARRLRERSSDLVDQASIDPEFVSQVESILAEARQLIRSQETRHRAVSVEYGDAAELAQQGELRARQNQHPAEALMAAEVLFDEAIPPFLDWADARTVEDALRVVQCLHRAIWRRFPPGAIAYTEALRQRLSSVHLESRLRLSRDLHDRVAHGIAAGVQRLDLLRMDASAAQDPELAAQLENVAVFFRSALKVVQDVAVDLRSRVGDKTLVQAVKDYIADSSDLPPKVFVTTKGKTFPLTAIANEEIFTIVQEALHNARRHAANATLISVEFTWNASALDVSVRDNGSGFDPDNIRDGALGLIVMRERAESIGASLEVKASRGRGSLISLHYAASQLSQA